jgi:hypothetical protein
MRVQPIKEFTRKDGYTLFLTIDKLTESEKRVLRERLMIVITDCLKEFEK